MGYKYQYTKAVFWFIFLFLTTAAFAGEKSLADKINETTRSISDASLITSDPLKGAVMDHLLVDAAIAAYGFSYWHWGTESLHAGHEGWFGKNTATGGSDKTGHFYMTYLLSRVLSSRMEDRGVSLPKANLYGSLSALLAMSLLEVGDATSHYGFSKEDLICDALGAFGSYLLRSYPKLDEFFDIRMEYLPDWNHLKHGDHTTDYSNMRHLIAFNLSGFDTVKPTPLRFVELQVGYYSRGFRSYDTVPKSRQVYFGIGINLKEVAKLTKVHALENLFEFYQPGHTYVDSNLWQSKEH